MFKKLIVPLVIILIFALNNSCKKKKPDCGCDSPNVDTVTTAIGGLAYDTAAGQFFISTFGFGSLIDNYICNSDFPDLQSLKDSARVGAVSVKFSGFVKDYCKITNGAYIDQPTSFVLTQITKN